MKHYSQDIFTSEASANIETLYNVVKHSPEVNACIVAQIEDIMADYWRFTSLSKNQKKMKAN